MTEHDRLQWLALTREEPLDPRRRIVDAHHHLNDAEGSRYLLDDSIRDTRAGHNVTHTVFVETMAGYRQEGPEALRPVGETEFVAAWARESDGRATRIAAIVSFADLTLGDALDEVLDAHELAGEGRFRGIRHPAAWNAHPGVPPGYMSPPPGLMTEEGFRRGIARLGERGYSFDAWIYHPQLPELAKLAQAAEGTTIVLNHLGVPLNVGPYHDRDAVRAEWRSGMRQLAAGPNAVVKLGGIGMDSYLFRTGWSSRARPPGSDEVVEWWGDDIRWCIDTFGPSRCMFEANYPVDREALGYTVIWNAFQKIAAGYSGQEQDDLFAGTAARVYRIDLESQSS
jgi:predicted TIM-barrel fold metal-dependent hydrolase